MTQPAGLASLNPGTGKVPYDRGQLGSIRLKTSRLPAFSFLAVLVLWVGVSQKRWGGEGGRWQGRKDSSGFPPRRLSPVVDLDVGRHLGVLKI